MKRVFISHPYSNDPENNKKSVDAICKKLIKNHDDILPISPVHLWSFMNDDGHYRNEILYVCDELIQFCDVIIFIVDYNGVDLIDGLSDGQLFEYKSAQRNNKKMLFIDRKDFLEEEFNL